MGNFLQVRSSRDDVTGSPRALPGSKRGSPGNLSCSSARRPWSVSWLPLSDISPDQQEGYSVTLGKQISSFISRSALWVSICYWLDMVSSCFKKNWAELFFLSEVSAASLSRCASHVVQAADIFQNEHVYHIFLAFCMLCSHCYWSPVW